MSLIISNRIAEKLKDKHKVSVKEVNECLLNREGKQLIDTRDVNQTDPPTMWFIALTNKNRCLKIVYIVEDGNIHLKSAFDADAESIRIYEKFGM